MSFVIITTSEKGITSFLVDRGRFKTKWWTYDIAETIIFFRLFFAEEALNKLKYNNPKIISYSEGQILHKRNNKKLHI